MCNMEVAISFLMLASVITRAVWGSEEQQRVTSSSSWLWILLWFFSFLSTKLKEKRLENLSTIWCPGENSGSRGEKEGNIPWDLIFESTIWPLIFGDWITNQYCENWSSSSEGDHHLTDFSKCDWLGAWKDKWETF